MKVPHTKKAVLSTLLAVPLLFTGVVFATGNYNNDRNCKDNTVTLSSVQTDKTKEHKDKDCKKDCQPVTNNSVTKGDQKEGHSKDCPTPPTDVCSNIDGVQATVPDGYTVADGVCTKTEVPVTPVTPVTPTVVTPTVTTQTTTPAPAEVAPVDNSFQGK